MPLRSLVGYRRFGTACRTSLPGRELLILYEASLPSSLCEGYLDIFVYSKYFSSPDRPDRIWSPTKPHSRYLGTGGEVDHPLPSTAEVKNEWTYASTPYMPSYYFTFACFICTKVSGVDVQPQCQSGLEPRMSLLVGLRLVHLINILKNDRKYVVFVL
jgi:hypothetical protein